MIRPTPIALALIAALGCTDAVVLPDAAPAAPAAVDGVTISMDFAAAGFYAAPFPSDHRPHPKTAAFPNPQNIEFVARCAALAADDSNGFGTTSGVFFQMTGPVSDTRPTVHETVLETAPVALIAVTGAAAGQRFPAAVDFRADPGPHGAPNLLSVLPIQGIPLPPETTIAAVVMRSLRDRDGALLGVSLPMATLAAGQAPSGLAGDAAARYLAAAATLAELGLDIDDIAGMAVFTTGDSTRGLADAAAEVAAGLIATPTPNGPFEPAEVFDDYCVYTATIDMPIFQGGDPPFGDAGGGWVVGDAGRLISQGAETARIVVAIPRTPMPPGGFPIVNFIRKGGGGDRPLVDRGVHAEAHGPTIEPGSGPARIFAAAGWAGVSVDGPHGGLRNITQSDEQFLMFNVTNPLALRDNVRQSALELILFADVIAALTVDASNCPGAAETVTFDAEMMALMGHSMGAWIAPLVLPYEPRYRAAILSGAGGSWIANLVHKRSPVAVKPFAEAILAYGPQGLEIHEHDPVLSLLQWAGEAADPAIYGRLIIDEPATPGTRHVLMLQGIVDTYILPPIANATSLSIGLDLAGPALDADVDLIGGPQPLAPLLPLIGRAQIDLPTAANRAPSVAVVVQHPEDGIEDGHEVVFQTAAPKAQYGGFLESLKTGAPQVGYMVQAPKPR